MTARLEARAVSLRRGARVVVDGASLALAGGDAVALVGPNAAGKSTLVRALAGLLAPAAGEVRLEGRPLPQWSRDHVARTIALVTPDESAPTAMTVIERARLGRYPHRGALRPLGADDHTAVTRALRRTGTEALAHRSIATLSAGERQLAALARGLSQEPRVLLLDEPAAHLDVGHQLGLFRVLDEVRAEGVAVLAVVHDLGRAAAWADRLVLLDRGRIVAEGPPHDVLLGPAAAAAFDVEIHAEALPGRGRPLYVFDERSPRR